MLCSLLFCVNEQGARIERSALDGGDVTAVANTSHYVNSFAYEPHRGRLYFLESRTRQSLQEIFLRSVHFSGSEPKLLLRLENVYAHVDVFQVVGFG